MLRTCTSLAFCAVACATAPSAMQSEQALQRAAQRMQAKVESRLVLWEDHSSWADAWRVKTPHFEVRTTRSYFAGFELATAAEDAIVRLQELLGAKDTLLAPAEIQVLPDLASYNAFGDAHGEHHSSYFGSFYASAAPGGPVAMLDSSNASLRKMNALHSVVHQYVARAFPQSQMELWLSEALASYISLTGQREWAKAELARLSAAGRPAFVSVGELVGATDEGFTDRSEARLLELGMLFAYLLEHREDTRSVRDDSGTSMGGFERLLRASVRGEARRDDPVLRFLREAPQEIEEDWRAFDGW